MFVNNYLNSPPLCAFMFSVRIHINQQTPTLSYQSLAAWESGPLNFLGPHPAFEFALQLSTSFTWEEHTMAFPTMPRLQAPTQGQRNNQPIRHCQASAPADNHQLLSRRKIGETTISCLG